MHIQPYKKDLPYSYAIGVFPTIELLTYQPQSVRGVFLSSKGTDNTGIEKIKTLCEKNKISCEINDVVLSKLAKSDNVYAIGVFEKYETPLDPQKNHVVLVNPSDMGNLGTIIRTMQGFGFADLALITPAADYFDPKVIRASMGAVFQTHIHAFDSFEKYQSCHSERSEESSISNTRTYYAFMLGGDQTLQQTTFTPPFSLVMGNEGAGLPETYRETCTPILIEQTNHIDSLNLSIATGIALYHAFVQK